VNGPTLFLDFFHANGVAGDLDFTPDGELVLYRAPQDRLGSFDLYAAPAEGGGETRLVSVGTSGGDVIDVTLTPDGTFAVYRVSDVGSLHSVLVDGSAAPVELGSGIGGRAVSAYRIDADGKYVFFLEDAAVAGVVELHTVPIDGVVPAMRLHPGLGGVRYVWGLELVA
jgi:Tol biopolymer transport system component